jgi:hypothetical protein
MFFIKFGHNASIQQVEGFPKDCERSCEGALHVRPGATKNVTKSELERLQELKIPLMVIREPVKVKVVESESTELPSDDVEIILSTPYDENSDLSVVENFDALEGHSVDSEEDSDQKEKKGKKRKKY